MTVSNLQRMERRARRVGLGTPTLRQGGAGKRSLEFHLPERPPATERRTMASAIPFQPQSTSLDPAREEEYKVMETTIRFPRAPEHLYDQSEVRAVAEAAIDAVADYPDGDFRFNPVVEEYAVHYDIPSGSMPDDRLGRFIRETWKAGDQFNRELERVR